MDLYKINHHWGYDGEINGNTKTIYHMISPSFVSSKVENPGGPVVNLKVFVSEHH